MKIREKAYFITGAEFGIAYLKAEDGQEARKKGYQVYKKTGIEIGDGKSDFTLIKAFRCKVLDEADIPGGIIDIHDMTHAQIRLLVVKDLTRGDEQEPQYFASPQG